MSDVNLDQSEAIALAKSYGYSREMDEIFKGTTSKEIRKFLANALKE